MVLSDADIIQRIGEESLVIDPYEESNVEPASVDLRLGNDFVQYSHYNPQDVTIDTAKGFDSLDQKASDCGEWDEITIEPGEFYLATTLERVSLPDDIVAEVLGRSSLGRLGISVHQTAGLIDPGFTGEITLELSNHGPAPVTLYAGDRICQIVFTELSSPALNPYGHEGSQYQNQSGATESGMQFK